MSLRVWMTVGMSPIFLAIPILGGSIEGRVTNSVTGEAVGGVEVRFLDRHSYVFQTSTDANGMYRLANLADGEYSGGFTRDGFSDRRSGPYVNASGAVPARLDAQLDPWGGLRGRVVDEDGKPAPRVRVELIKGPTTSTDENGEFKFTELVPGAYRVVAKPEPKTRVEDGVRLGVVPVYYPAATELADAVPVTVAWGADVAGIAMRLKSVPVRRVAGVVMDSSGKPVGKATVRLLGRRSAMRQEIGYSVFMAGNHPFFDSAIVGPGAEPEMARVESGADGSFEFPAVAQGDWRVSAEAGEDDDHPMSGVAPAVVTGTDLDSVRIRLSPPFPVAVSLARDGTNAPEKSEDSAAAYLSLVAREGQPRLTIDPAANVEKIQGIFPGRYLVLGRQTYGAWHVGSILLGGADVLGQEVELAEGFGPLQVVLKRDAGTLRGMVQNGGGAHVFLMRRELGELVHYLQTECKAGGAFGFDDVVPGDYYVVAFAQSPARGLPPEDLPGPIVPLATGVTVAAGSTANVELTVSRWPW